MCYPLSDLNDTFEKDLEWPLLCPILLLSFWSCIYDLIDLGLRDLNRDTDCFFYLYFRSKGTDLCWLCTVSIFYLSFDFDAVRVLINGLLVSFNFDWDTFTKLDRIAVVGVLGKSGLKLVFECLTYCYFYGDLEIFLLLLFEVFLFYCYFKIGEAC